MLLSFLKPFPEYSDTYLKENLNNSISLQMEHHLPKIKKRKSAGLPLDGQRHRIGSRIIQT